MIVNALMERRLLVNYRVEPEVLAAGLPAPFRPVVVDGHGIAGICLIRLGGVRPAGLPSALGLTTEDWAIAPLHVDEVRSSFFDDPRRFPAGTAVVDSAFLMAELQTTWRPQSPLLARTDTSRGPQRV